jgi:hypothetical protein
MMMKSLTINFTTSSLKMNEPTQTIKLIRLQSGEDLIAGLTSNSESGLVMLDNPMHLIFKRSTQGTVMMLLPWLPIELINDNIATIYESDILTVVEPKPDLVEYYGNVINHTQMAMLKSDQTIKSLREELEDLNDEEEDEDPEGYLTKEDVVEMVARKRKNRLH